MGFYEGPQTFLACSDYFYFSTFGVFGYICPGFGGRAVYLYSFLRRIVSLRKLREQIKDVMYCCPPLRAPAVWVYQYRGRRPWSFGYSFYKYGYIRRVIEGNLDIFRAGPLPQEYGAGLDERAVECPWFFTRLKSGERRILDAGSSLNHYDLLNLFLWQGRELHITTLANEGRPAAAVKPVYAYQDLRRMGYPDGSFDAVVCISTLEHVGMDNTLLYTGDARKKEHKPEAYLEALDEMKRVLKNGGSLYLTMPYGQHRDLGWFQVFDAGMVDDVQRHFAPRAVTVEYFKYAQGQWDRADKQSCAQGRYADIHTGVVFAAGSPAASECVVCMEMTK